MTKMYIKVICVLFIGLFANGISGVAKNKLHLKIHVPRYMQQHRHTKVVYVTDKESGDYGNTNKGHIVLKKPEDKVKYNNHVKAHFHNNPNNFKPHFDDDYHQSWKTMKSEKYETESIDNPFSDNPSNKYIVKGRYQVREKLPYEDTTHGYDHEYNYPTHDVDHDYYKNADFVNYHSTQNDPFAPDHQNSKTYNVEKVTSAPIKQKKPKEFHYHYKSPADDSDYHDDYKQQKTVPVKQKNKPKEVHYHYQYPPGDYDYHKNVHLVDFYLAKNGHDVSAPLYDEPNKSIEDGGNDVNYYSYLPPSEKYEHFDHDDSGPSEEKTYQKYKAHGPSFEYLYGEFGDFSEINEKIVQADVKR